MSHTLYQTPVFPGSLYFTVALVRGLAPHRYSDHALPRMHHVALTLPWGFSSLLGWTPDGIGQPL